MFPKTIFTAVAVIIAINAPAQTNATGTTLEECYSLAEKNYPLIKKYSIVEKSREYSLENANKAYLPQFSLGAQATYQSEVTSLSVSGLPVGIPSIPKDQYKTSVSLTQIIWDGGAVSSTKKLTEAGAKVDLNSLKTDLYSIKERINNLFFGILLSGEQIRQTEIYAAELQINYQNIESYISAGVANQADLDIVKVEQLKNVQNQKELESTKRSYLQMLSYFTGKEITALSAPVPPEEIFVSQENRRPEIELFDAQIEMLETRKLGINASVMPKFQLFAEGGYGNPALNMLKPGWRLYGMGGIRLAWNFGSFYTRKGEINLLNNNKNSIENQRDIFLFNTRMEAMQKNGEIEKMKQLLADDDKIISLKENIVNASRAKTENGTMTVNEFLKELNSSQEAKQKKIYHQVQLMLAIYNLKYTLNQ